MIPMSWLWLRNTLKIVLGLIVLIRMRLVSYFSEITDMKMIIERRRGSCCIKSLAVQLLADGLILLWYEVGDICIRVIWGVCVCATGLCVWAEFWTHTRTQKAQCVLNLNSELPLHYRLSTETEMKCIQTTAVLLGALLYVRTTSIILNMIWFICLVCSININTPRVFWHRCQPLADIALAAFVTFSSTSAGALMTRLKRKITQNVMLMFSYVSGFIWEISGRTTLIFLHF